MVVVWSDNREFDGEDDGRDREDEDAGGDRDPWRNTTADHELAGNVSLNQELRFIETVNEWIETGKLDDDEFTRTDGHRIEMGETLHCSTKLDRSPEFIDDLLALGEARAAAFLEGR